VELISGMLVSARNGSWFNPATSTYERLPGEDPYYPFGPTSAAVLPDGTFFVAVHMQPATTGGGFIRMWHLDTDMTVLGQHDETFADSVTPMGNTSEIAIGLDGNKVMLIVNSDSGDRDYTIFVEAVGRAFDTGSAIDTSATPSDSTLTHVGDPTVQQYFSGASIYSQIVDPNSAAMVSALLGTPLNPIGAGIVVKDVKFRANFNSTASGLTGATWRLSDDRLAYGSATLASGTGITGSYTAGGWTTFTDFALPLTDPQKASLVGPLNAGALRFAFIPGTTGTRKVAGILLKVTVGTP
jgi:hypothetical protein